MIKEYKCKDCDNTVEVWERFDKVPEKCPVCGGVLYKIISKSTFHLKGAGWYTTDYKNNKQKSKGKGV
jgi:putative FmdB family regulatory protein